MAYYGPRAIGTRRQGSADRRAIVAKRTRMRLHPLRFTIGRRTTRSFAMRIPPNVVRTIIDTPAALQRLNLVDITRGADRFSSVLP
jgi:hypothetical protein